MNTIYEHVIPPTKGIFVELSKKLEPSVKEMMIKSGKTQLYSHQSEAYEAVINGNNICLQTNTASGKTIGALLPMIDYIVKNPGSRVLIVVPTKALASNMAQKITELLEYLNSDYSIVVGVYDGDTTKDNKQWVIKNASILITNPEMLNVGLLPRHIDSNSVGRLFDNLRFVFVDEIHEYSGVVGSNISLLFARLDRICRLHGSEPVYACATATIANPVELSEGLFRRHFQLINKSGAPSGEKHIFLMTPGVDKDGMPKAPHTLTTTLSKDLILYHKKHIVFCGSRNTTEVIVKEVGEKIKRHPTASPKLARKIKAYRSGYSSTERSNMEKSFSNGGTLALASTNALELGVDIPGVDNLIQNGLPRSICSFWQQTGRAGRGNRPSNCYTILGNSPREQYIKNNPEWLFNAESESAVINPFNRNIQMQHLKAAVYEAPLSQKDADIFPQLESMCEELAEIGEVVKRGDCYHWCGSSFPANDINIRGISEPRYNLINTETGELVTECCESNAFRELYQDAICMINREQYRIEALDCDNHVAYCYPDKVDYYTEAISVSSITITDYLNEKAIANSNCSAGLGGIKNLNSTVGYKCIQFHTRQILSQQSLNEPLTRVLDTVGFWINVPAVLLKKEQINSSTFDSEMLSAIARPILVSAAMATQADPNKDITYGVNEGKEGSVNIIFYDSMPGGMGFSEKAFERIEEVLSNAIQSVKNCKCDDGCFECIGTDAISKESVLKILQEMLGETFYSKTQSVAA